MTRGSFDLPHYVVRDLGTLHPDPDTPPGKPTRYLGDSGATDISETGIVTGWSEYADFTTARHTFRWTANGGMQDIAANVGMSSEGRAVNSAGTVVGWATLIPFRSRGDGLELIGNGGTGAAFDVNDVGTAAGMLTPAGTPTRPASVPLPVDLVGR